MRKNILQNNRAFTLIETLVAIAILMIAIAGPLTVAHKGYTSALDARNQSIAINLAQEGMEFLNNVKDNKTWGGWSDGKSFDEAVGAEYVKCTSISPCTFTQLPATGIFARSYYFAIQNINQVLVVVNVSWNTALLQGQIRLDQIFTNETR